MKHILLIITFFVCLQRNYGQVKIETIKDSLGIYTEVDVNPSFPGGDNGWKYFLQKNLNPAILAENNAPDGTYTVFVKFIVRKDGTLTDIFCENYPGYGVCEEGLRVIKKSPKWKPGLVNGQPVDARKRQPIFLQIQSGN